MRQDEPTRPVRVPRLRSVHGSTDPMVATEEEEEFELRAQRAMACDTRETERIIKIDREGER